MFLENFVIEIDRCHDNVFCVFNVFTEGRTDLPKEEIRGLIGSRWDSVSDLFWKPIATCDFPRGPDKGSAHFQS